LVRLPAIKHGAHAFIQFEIGRELRQQDELVTLARVAAAARQDRHLMPGGHQHVRLIAHHVFHPTHFRPGGIMEQGDFHSRPP